MVKTRYTNNNFTISKARGKRALAAVIHDVRRCNVVFTLENALQIHVNVCDRVQLLAGIIQCNGGKLEEAEDFIVC